MQQRLILGLRSKHIAQPWFPPNSWWPFFLGVKLQQGGGILMAGRTPRTWQKGAAAGQDKPLVMVKTSHWPQRSDTWQWSHNFNLLLFPPCLLAMVVTYLLFRCGGAGIHTPGSVTFVICHWWTTRVVVDLPEIDFCPNLPDIAMGSMGELVVWSTFGIDGLLAT